MISFNANLPLPVWFELINKTRPEVGVSDIVAALTSPGRCEEISARDWLMLFGIVRCGTSDMLRLLHSLRLQDLTCLMVSSSPRIRVMRFRNPREEHLIEALHDDSVSKFELYRSLGFFRITPPLLRYLLMCDDARAITMRVIEESDRLLRKTPKWTLFTYLAAYCKNEDKCIDVTESLLGKGLNLSGEADRLGLTALSYTFFPRLESFRENSSSRPRKFEDYLMAKGCNPYHKDVFGSTYDQVAKVFYV